MLAYQSTQQVSLQGGWGIDSYLHCDSRICAYSISDDLVYSKC